MTGRSLMAALASIAIVVLLGLRLVPAAGHDTGIVTHGSHAMAWSQPVVVPEDGDDALPALTEQAFRVASVAFIGNDAAAPSRASTRPPAPPFQRARSQLDRAAGVATPADPY